MKLLEIERLSEMASWPRLACLVLLCTLDLTPGSRDDGARMAASTGSPFPSWWLERTCHVRGGEGMTRQTFFQFGVGGSRVAPAW